MHIRHYNEGDRDSTSSMSYSFGNGSEKNGHVSITCNGCYEFHMVKEV